MPLTLGHHRSACAVAGVLGRRGFPLENAAARICREAGGRVRTNVLVRDLDLHAITTSTLAGSNLSLTDSRSTEERSWPSTYLQTSGFCPIMDFGLGTLTLPRQF